MTTKPKSSTSAISSLQDKLARAQQQHATALAALAVARRTYEEGSGQAYAAMLERQADLRGKIATNQAAAETAQGTFKRLFAAASHVVTKEVKTALNSKNDALAIAEELQLALAESEEAAFEPSVKASSQAESYQAAYQRAYASYAQVQVYQALVECADRLGRALALAGRVPCEAESLVFVDALDARLGFAWTALKALAMARPEASGAPQVDELGTLDLGPFQGRPFLSKALVHQQRVRMQQQAGELATA